MTNDDRFPLHAAAMRHRADVVAALLEQGADVNERDRSGLPPLYRALTPIAVRPDLAGEQAATVAALIAAGARLDMWTVHGHPLHWACSGGRIDLAREIADRGVPIEIRTPHGGLTPLAVGAAHRAIVDWLLASGADPSPADCARSPLATALRADADDCVGALRAAGAVLTALDDEELLVEAVMHMNSHQVRRLVELGADLRRPIEEGTRTLRDVFEECRQDDAELRDAEDDETLAHQQAIEALLDAAGVTATDDDGESLYEQFSDIHDRQELEAAIVAADLPADDETLSYLVYHGPPGLIPRFVHAGARIAGVPWDALFDVARLGSNDKLAALLDAGLDARTRGGEHATPLIHGPVDDHLHDGIVERLQMLLDRGAEVDATDDRGWTALLVAAAQGRTDELGPAQPMIGRVEPEAIELLLGAGASIAARSRAGYTMAHAAAVGGLLDLLERAVAAGAPVDGANQFGRTPLHEAARAGHLEIVDWLAARGARIDAEDCAGSTPLSLAIAALKAPVALRLLELGARVDATDLAGRTTLALAFEVGLVSIAPALLAAGADASARDHTRATPLHACCKSSSLRYMSTLLAFTPSDQIDGIERKVAEVAVEGARVLLDAGADVNAADLDGQTPLHVAAAQRMILDGQVSPAMVELLLAAGADATATDREGKTPLDRALSDEVKACLGGHI